MCQRWIQLRGRSSLELGPRGTELLTFVTSGSILLLTAGGGGLPLAELQERICKAAPDKAAKIVQALGPDYGYLIRFIVTTGVRPSGALLTITDRSYRWCGPHPQQVPEQAAALVLERAPHTA